MTDVLVCSGWVGGGDGVLGVGGKRWVLLGERMLGGVWNDGYYWGCVI